MQQAIRKFLVAAIVLSLFLFVVSVVFVLRSKEELDADSMMLALLLLAFSSIASLILGVILFKMRRQE